MSILNPLKLKVLISGAGIAGPCLAYWLAKTRHNISITIVERSPSPRVTGQALDIHGPAVEIVKKMGLLEVIRACSTTEEGTRFMKPSGKSFAGFEKGDSFTAEYEILRADLSRLFLEATERLSNVRYMYSDFIKSLEQKDKEVSVAFASGSKDTFDLVVAADGATSTTRAMILDEKVLKDSTKLLGWYTAFFSIPRQLTDPKLWQVYNVPKGLCVMLRPHRNSSTMGAYLCITLPSKGQRDPAIDEAMEQGTEATKRILHKYFDNAGWQTDRILEGMDRAEDFYMARTAQVKLPKWTSKRALVIGDSAFATFGVGTTLAIESAYILAGELSKIHSSDDIPQALEKYEEVFRELSVDDHDLPPGFPQLVFPQTAWGLKLLKSVAWFASKTKMHKLIQGSSDMGWKVPEYDWVH
jgi:2-polyprenyl-6-methoxyphenol hydroxylase-like FAD-dependent oxidoreductase